MKFDLKYGKKCHAFASIMIQTRTNYDGNWIGGIGGICVTIPLTTPGLFPLPLQVSQFHYAGLDPALNDEFWLKVIHLEDAMYVNAWLIRLLGIKETHPISIIGRLMMGSVWDIYEYSEYLSTANLEKEFGKDIANCQWNLEHTISTVKAHDACVHAAASRIQTQFRLWKWRKDVLWAGMNNDTSKIYEQIQYNRFIRQDMH